MELRHVAIGGPRRRAFLYTRAPPERGRTGQAMKIRSKAGLWGAAQCRQRAFEGRAFRRCRHKDQATNQAFQAAFQADGRCAAAYAKSVCEQTATVSVCMTPVEHKLAGNRPPRGQVAYRTALALFLAACACAVRGRSPFKMHGSGTALRASTLCRAIYG